MNHLFFVLVILSSALTLQATRLDSKNLGRQKFVATDKSGMKISWTQGKRIKNTSLTIKEFVPGTNPNFGAVIIGTSELDLVQTSVEDGGQGHFTGIDGSADFSIVSNSCSVPTNYPCFVEVRYTPTTVGPVTAYLRQTYYPEFGPPGSIDILLEGAGILPEPPPECPAQAEGSIVDLDSSSLREFVDITGTEFTLFYSSAFTSDYVTQYPNASRLSHFNPEGWMVSHVHYLDIARNTLFTGTGRWLRRAQVPGNNGTVLIVEGDDVFEFDSTGKHLQTRSLLRGYAKYTFTYDNNNKLSKITDSFGQETLFNRDSNGVLTSITSPFGQITTIGTDSVGLINQFTNPKAESWDLNYYPGTELIENFNAPNGKSSNFGYRTSGRLLWNFTTAGTGMEVFQNHDGTSPTVEKSTPLGRTTRYGIFYDAQNYDYRRTTTTPDGFLTSYRELPNYAREIFDVYESITTTTQPDERFGFANMRTTSVSQTINNLTRLTQFEQSTNLSNPNDPYSYSQIVKTTRVNGIARVTETYDKTANTSTFVDATGVTTVVSYNSVENPVSVQFGADTPITFTYDNLGRLISQTQNGQNTTTYTYDILGRIRSITNALNQQTQYRYDELGQPTRIILPDSREIRMQYNAKGQMTSITPPGRPVHRFFYNEGELLGRYTPPALAGITNAATVYSYDLDKSLTRIRRPDGQVVRLGYIETSGLLRSIVLEPSVSQVYNYFENTNKPRTIRSPDQITSRFTYFGHQAVDTERQTLGTDWMQVNFNFDNFFRQTVRRIDVDGAMVARHSTAYRADGQPSRVGEMALTYNANDGRLRVTRVDNVRAIRSYDTYGNLRSYAATYTPEGGAAQALYSYVLTRDTLHRITRIVETVQGVSTTYNYTYDTVGRLATVTKNNVLDSQYEYDSNSNKISGTINGVSFTAAYDDQDRLLTMAGLNYTYNENGELTQVTNGIDATTTYNHDQLGRLKSVTLPSTNTINYNLDWQGRRSVKLVNNTTVQRAIFEDSYKVAYEILNGIGKEYVYATNVNSPDYIRVAGVNYKILKDHLGSPRLVVRTTDGNIAQRMDYNEWGKVISDTNPGFQAFGFAGGIYDQDTKLVKFGARDYDPSTGRWLSKDPILFEGGDANLYGYVLQDPVNWIDVDGLTRTRALPEGGGGGGGSWMPTGYTRHGINRAIGDGSNRGGVCPASIKDTLKNPIKVTTQSDNSIRIDGSSSTVVLTPSGQVRTMWPTSGGVRGGK